MVIKSFFLCANLYRKNIADIEIGFLLNEDGDLLLGIKAPAIFKEAIKNLLDF
jgi:hypothetical protein